MASRAAVRLWERLTGLLPAPPRTGPPHGVLILSSGGLGDTVLFSLVLERLRSLAKSGEPVTVLLRRDAGKMAFLLGDGITVKLVDYTRLGVSISYRRKIFGELYAANYRLAVSADFLRHPDLDEAMLKAARADETLAMRARPWNKYDAALAANRRHYSRLFESGPDHLDKVIRWSRFADWLTGTSEPAPKVSLSAADIPVPPAGDPFVVLIPFSAVRGKQPSPEMFAEILARIPETHRVVIAGAPGEMEQNPGYKFLLDRDGTDYDSSDFQSLAPILAAARLVITVDTGAMHLAAGLGAPTICLASAAYVDEIVPYAPEITPENITFFHTPMDCQGCLGGCIHPLENEMFRCVARLEIEPVLNRIDTLLAESAAT